MRYFHRFPRALRTVQLTSALAAAFAFLSGCQVAPSKTMSGAGTGLAGGAVVGGVVGGATGNTSKGVLAGAAAGTIIGGIVGLTQEIKERKEQDRLAQERAYQQELAKKRGEEAKAKAELDEELAIAQGFQISDMELNEAKQKVDNASSRLAKLREERNNALAKKKSLDEAQEKLLATEAEIARLEEELARLKGAAPDKATADAAGVMPTTATRP